MFRSIQTKILFYIMVTTVVALILIGGFTSITVRNSVESLNERNLQNQALLEAQIIQRSGTWNKGNITEAQIRKLPQACDLEGCMLVSDNGGKVNYRDSEIPYSFEKSFQIEHIYKNKLDYVSAVAIVGKDAAGNRWYVVCEETVSNAYKSLNNMNTIIITIIVLAFFGLWILGKRYSFEIQRPIKKMAVDATCIADGDISHGIDYDENDELKVIADAFNKMLDNLKATMKQVLDMSGKAASMNEIMEYIERTYEELPTGILGINTLGEITNFNSEAETLTGIKAERVLGLDIKNPVPAEIKNLIAPLNKCMALGSLQLKTIGDITNIYGEKIPVEYSINILFGVKNEVIGAICVFRSISDIERFKESAERSKHLGALGEMAANLAHEIKNPLASIRGYAQFVRNELEDRGVETEEMDIVMHEVDKLTEMLDMFLKFARPETPKFEICDIRDVVSYVLKLVERDLPANITVEAHLANVPNVAVDRKQMEPVFLNLIINAIQAMQDGGRLVVNTGYESRRNMVKVEIIDNGCGIPQEFSENIFQPFFTTKENGTGLGLAICSRTVESHKGIIEVESIEGEMTKFTILLQAKVSGGRQYEH